MLGSDFARHGSPPHVEDRPCGFVEILSGEISRRDVFGLRRRIPVRGFGTTRARSFPCENPDRRKMSSGPKQVVVCGSFDDIRSQQVRFLEEAAKHGSVSVLLWNDASVRRLTGVPPKFPEAERLYLLKR